MKKDEALELVKEDGSELENLPDIFKKDKEIVLAAVENNDLSLEFADINLLKDKKFILLINKRKQSGLLKKNNFYYYLGL